MVVAYGRDYGVAGPWPGRITWSRSTHPRSRGELLGQAKAELRKVADTIDGLCTSQWIRRNH